MPLPIAPINETAKPLAPTTSGIGTTPKSAAAIAAVPVQVANVTTSLESSASVLASRSSSFKFLKSHVFFASVMSPFQPSRLPAPPTSLLMLCGRVDVAVQGFRSRRI